MKTLTVTRLCLMTVTKGLLASWAETPQRKAQEKTLYPKRLPKWKVSPPKSQIGLCDARNLNFKTKLDWNPNFVALINKPHA